MTAAIAAYNLAPFGDAVTVRQELAEETDLAGVDAVWLDPARRTSGHSETARARPEDYSPSLDWVFDLAERIPTGIKLGPGLDRALIPDDVEAQWVSADGSTVELVLWSGALAREGVRRAALVMRGEHGVGAHRAGGCRGRAGPAARRVRARAGRRRDPRAPDRRCRPLASRRACSTSRSPI